MRKPETRWTNAHKKLKSLYAERIEAAGMSQSEFGKAYGIGTQGMVWQYLNGYRPLSYESAAKFAKGLGCRIGDISPEMAEELAHEVLPQLGLPALKRAVKAAMTAVVLLLVTPQSEDSSAAILHKAILSQEGEKGSFIQRAQYTYARILAWIVGLSSQFLSAA